MRPMQLLAASIRAMPEGQEKQAAREHQRQLRDCFALNRRVRNLIAEKKAQSRTAA